MAGLILYLAFYYAQGILSRFLSIFSAILTAIAGIFIKSDWDKLKGNSLLEKKGWSAIRNLGSIGEQISQIRNWIKFFISRKTVTKRELEEVDRHLGTMVMNIRSGLADWIDIVPELKKTEEVARSYEDVIKTYIEEILRNKKELVTVGENQELRERLERRIKELEKSIRDLKKEQPKVFASGLRDTISVAPSSVFESTVFPSSFKTCLMCGKTYLRDFSTISALSPHSNICPECQNKQTLSL